MSFIRVPRLFFSLLFWPLLIGLGVAFVQIGISVAYLKLVTETPESMEREINRERTDEQWIRSLLFATSAPLPTPQTCRWNMVDGVEQPPPGDCKLEPYDVVIRTSAPEAFDSTKYQQFFDGATRRIHICKTCGGNIVLEQENDAMVANIYSLPAIGVYMLKDVATTRELSKNLINILEQREDSRELESAVYLHPAGYNNRINLTTAGKTMILVVNISAIVIITLWLALRAHRKVLDYFARNDALLPLVAACGKHNFYNSLWIITVLRVSFFLFASVPTTFLLYNGMIDDGSLTAFVNNLPELTHWILTILMSLGAVTLIASIGELKQRATWHSFIYKYLPLSICIGGTVLWFFSLFFKGTVWYLIQQTIAALPVVGLSPLLISPIVKLDHNIITVHAILSTLLIVVALKLNARWFAAHLEEI